MGAASVENDSGMVVDLESLQAQAEFMMDLLGLHPDVELAVTLVGEEEMGDLHQRWLGEAGPTDVLSFPMDELMLPNPGESATPGILGDIVICPQVAAAQSEASGANFRDELTMLLTHGILHLLGFDHATQQEHAEMFGRQDELIVAWTRSVDKGGKAG